MVDPVYDADRKARDGASVAKLTSALPRADWPKGMRVIARRATRKPSGPASERVAGVPGLAAAWLEKGTSA